MSKLPLQIEGLVKDYGPFRAVDNVAFDIQPGEVFGLLGPNGAGKTSIISMITTLLKPTSGLIEIFGVDLLKNPTTAKRHIGCVPQELIHHGYFTTQEIVYFHASYYGKVDKEWIEYLLKRMNLWSQKDQHVNKLSGGMKRALLIIKALVHKPKLLLLDEPTAGVDIELRESLWSFTRELKKSGTSILLTTHYLEEAESLCDRVGILSHGKLLRVDHLGHLLNDLGKRTVTIKITEAVPSIDHPALVAQDDSYLEFSISRECSIGELLGQMNIRTGVIADIHIREGKLEDAFRSVINQK